MSLRDLLKSERLKIQLAATEAKSGGMGISRLGGLRGGLLGTLGSRIPAPRGEEVRMPMQGQPNPPMAVNFEPKTPILSLFMGGSRPLRELGRNLLQSTQQEQPQTQPQENPNPEPKTQITCPMCGSSLLEYAEFCPKCGHIRRGGDEGGTESWSLSVQA